MSEKSRSLASYFDYPGDTSHNWHDQTEPLQTLSGATGQPRGLGRGLSEWGFAPGHTEMIWIPHGQHGQNVPEGVKVHYKSNKVWDSSDWGYDEYIQKMAQSHRQKSEIPKQERPRMTPDERKIWKAGMAEQRQETRMLRSKHVKALHEKAYQILIENQAWDDEIFPVITSITDKLSQAKAQSKQKIEDLKAAGVKGSAKTKALHAETSNYIHDDRWAQKLSQIDGFCTRNNLINTLGTTLPAKHENGTRYLSVEIMFLSKAKQVIMSGILHLMTVKAKAGAATQAQCEFVNTSYKANDIIIKLRGKDRFLHKYDTKLEDSAALEACRRMILKLEVSRFRQLHRNSKKKTLPKHLRYAPPAQTSKHGKKKDKKGSGHSSQKEEQEVKRIISILHREQNAKHHHAKRHHKHQEQDRPHSPSSRRMPRANRCMSGYHY